MADVGGTLTFDDITVDSTLPDGLPSFIPMTDGSAITKLDASLNWPAYGVGLRRVFSPDTHTLYKRFTEQTARQRPRGTSEGRPRRLRRGPPRRGLDPP